MKIVSWNCHYGFLDYKADVIKKYNADILIIPECREQDMEIYGDEKHRDWYGDHLEAKTEEGINKTNDFGIGVFWKKGITINRLPEWDKNLSANSDYRYLIPYIVYGKFEPFTLIAVWTKNSYANKNQNDRLDYVLKAHAAVEHYEDIGLLNGRVIIIGDFNSDTVWDGEYPKDKNHTSLIDKLKKNKIFNCTTISGEKNNSTYYYYTKNKEKQVVDDHCFASDKIAKTAKVFVPGATEWKPDSNGNKHWNGSDHCPICVEFDL